jgi:hypothetical protein
MEDDDILENDNPEVETDEPEVVEAPRTTARPKQPKTTVASDTDGDISYWKRETASARREAQKHRTNLRNAESERDAHATRAAKYDMLLESFGIEDENSFDPKSFADDYGKIVTSHQHTRRQYEVHKRASKAGADPDLLLDSNSFMNKVVGLDPDDKKFGSSLDSLIKEALDSGQHFTAKPKSPASSAATTEVRGSDGEMLITEDKLATMSTKEIVDAQKAGKLKHLGF